MDVLLRRHLAVILEYPSDYLKERIKGVCILFYFDNVVEAATY